jgi:hypothetical protein
VKPVARRTSRANDQAGRFRTRGLENERPRHGGGAVRLAPAENQKPLRFKREDGKPVGDAGQGRKQQTD